MVSTCDRPIYSIKAPIPNVVNRIPHYLQPGRTPTPRNRVFIESVGCNLCIFVKNPVSGPPCVSPNVVESPPIALTPDYSATCLKSPDRLLFLLFQFIKGHGNAVSLRGLSYARVVSAPLRSTTGVFSEILCYSPV